MADSEGQERSEEPTGRRIQKAREEGQVPRSKELSTMAVLMSGAIALLIFGSWIAEALFHIFQDNLVLHREDLFDKYQMGRHVLGAAEAVIWALLPFFIIMVIASIAGNTALGGFLWSTKALKPKFSKLNPIEGIKRLFSLDSLVELGKSVLKVTLVVAFTLAILNARTEPILHLSQEPLKPAILNGVKELAWAFFMLSCAMIVISSIDIPWQMHSYKKKLKMTKQEVKDEMKDIEGKPEIKGKIRRLQYEAAQRRMMRDVPDADVVITNPDHYAVALKYDSARMAAPVLLAKGTDLVAMKIKEIATAHKIEILSAPPLARSVYYHTEIGQEVPSGLYMAVAQALAYVFQLRRFRAGYNSQRPSRPDFPVPDDLKHD